MTNQVGLFDQKTRAQDRAQSRFKVGVAAQAALVDKIAGMVIRDKLVAPAAMNFEVVDGKELADGLPSLKVFYRVPTSTQSVDIHRHALGQLAAKVEIPMTFVNKLNVRIEDTWRLELLAKNFNELFHHIEGDARFLHRIVGDELRGFLSRRFNRHLASLPMLNAFIEACRSSLAHPVEAITTDVRWSLKCYLPMVFEPFPGQFICVGVEETNSDFGAGRLLVRQTVWDPIRDSRTILDESISRVHLGSIIEDSDIEMSDETAAKEVEAQASAINDAVTQLLSEEAIDRLLTSIKLANEQQIPWQTLKGQLSRILYDKEILAIETLLNTPTIVDLPPVGRTASGAPIPTRWWASSVVAALSNNVEEDRKIDLQQQAGKILGVAFANGP